MAARKLKAVPPISKTHSDRVLAEYPYTDCREQHVWIPYDGRLDERRKIAYRVQTCANCPTLRKSELSMRESTFGQLLRSSNYKYPKDYKIPGGLDISERGRMRMANFLRDLESIENKKGKKK